MSKPSAKAAPTIEIAVEWGDLTSMHGKGNPPVDVISAGHYTGVEPQSAELYLDKAISKDIGSAMKGDDVGVIGRMTRRGLLNLGLGEPYTLPFKKGCWASIAGLGEFGSLGPAQLQTMVKNFCWSLSQSRRRHLATVLIGSGEGNMSLSMALDAWLAGIYQMSMSSSEWLQRVTIVEFDPERFLMIREALSEMGPRPRRNLSVVPADEKQVSGAAQEVAKALRKKASEIVRKKRLPASKASINKGAPTRIMVSTSAAGLTFAALTDSASIPERQVATDPSVLRMVSENAGLHGDSDEQKEWCQVLRQLLIPCDLEGHLFKSAAPVVLTLDAASARLPWELLAVPDQGLAVPPVAGGVKPSDGTNDASAWSEDFIALSEQRGITRQFRSLTVPVLQTRVTRRKNLRVLIVADPASDAPLVDARKEGEELKALLAAQGDIEVVALLGPTRARLPIVISRLMRERYDVLHFAGHSDFNESDPARSGWLFSKAQDLWLNPALLSRLTRIPPLVVSNSCTSGGIAVNAAPNTLVAAGLAEAFFKLGARNYVCTGWPVGSEAARAFAVEFYKVLLAGSEIRQAMIKGRLGSANAKGGTSTWGAYQHYGSPYFRLTEA